MEAARGDLSEARLADDVDEAVVDCSTVKRASSASSVSDHVDEPRSGSCVSPDDDSSMENANDAEQSEIYGSPGEMTADVEATTTTTASTSVPLLEQLVSSPCELVTPSVTSCAESTSSPPTSDADGQCSLNKSFLQKLESFVSSVGQAAATAPLTSWIRRPLFPSRCGAGSGGGAHMAARRPEPPAMSMFSVPPSFFASPPAADVSRPLDLSAKRMESLVPVDSTQSSQQRRVDLLHESSGQSEVVDDVSEVQTNAASSLACLERDFGEHSTIFTRLGSSRDRQRRTVVPSVARGGTAGRRGRTAVMPGLTPVAHNATGARLCAPGAATAPHTELHPPRSYIGNDRCLPTGGRTGVMGGKLDARQPAMSATTAATALRCLQCGRTFYSLPELTLHMIQSAHYANLICAAAAYSYDDDEDCVVVDAYNSRQTSNVGIDHSTHRSEALQLPRAKVLTEMVDAHRGDQLCRSNGDIRRLDCVDAAVSPARSLDDESVSSAGLTETESQRSPTSTGSPTSPPYENVASGGTSDDELAIMSHLLRLQPLLSRTVLDNMQSSPAIPAGYIDWTKMGLAAAEERRRQLIRGRTSRSSMRQLDKSPAADSLPIDMRCQRADENRYRDSQPRQTVKIPELTPRPTPNAYLQKLLDDVRGYRSSLNAGIKRSASSKWYNGKQRTKKHRTCSISSSDCDQMLLYDGPRLNGDRSTVMSAVAPTSGEACLRKRDDGIHARRETVSNVRISPSELNHEHLSSRWQEMADCTRRSTSKDAAIQQPVVIDAGTPNSPALPVGGRDSDKPNVPGRDFRRPGVDKDQSEYAARFGKYYRLAQELSSKSE